jgi:hypothetical protein
MRLVDALSRARSEPSCRARCCAWSRRASFVPTSRSGSRRGRRCGCAWDFGALEGARARSLSRRRATRPQEHTRPEGRFLILVTVLRSVRGHPFNPGVSGRDPGRSGRDPGVSGRDPGVSGRDPGRSRCDPGLSGCDPGWVSIDPHGVTHRSRVSWMRTRGLENATRPFGMGSRLGFLRSPWGHPSIPGLVDASTGSRDRNPASRDAIPVGFPSMWVSGLASIHTPRSFIARPLEPSVAPARRRPRDLEVARRPACWRAGRPAR